MSAFSLPSVAIYTTLVVSCSSFGYWLGYGQFEFKRTTRAVAAAAEDESEDEADNEGVSALPSNEDCKLVLVVRSDLGMSSGKIAAQCSHATLACYKTMATKNPKLLRLWERSGQAKIALKCKDEEELLLLEAQATSLNLVARSIQDAGRTQVAPGSRTVLGIAGPVRMVNMVTGNLRLL